MKDKELIKKIKEWLSDNITECIDIPENICLKEDNKRIERQTRCLKDTLKDGNGINKDYCKWLLDNQD